MKAILFNKKNPKNKLQYSETEKPIPNENELLVEVHASSINAADYRLITMGLSPKKKIFGADISGVVLSAGKNVSIFKAGDKIMGDLSNHGFGGFAEYVTLPQDTIIIKRESISFEEAASIPLAGTTALQALQDKGNIQRGQKVLLVGSSGGVGTFALQLAKYFGAGVTAVCSSKNIAQSKLLGADRIIDYTNENFGEKTGEYDLILALNGDYPLGTYKKCLKPGGKFILVGGSISQIFKMLLFGKLMSFGTKKMINLFARSNPKNIDFLATLVKDKKIKPVIEKVYSLENLPEAMRYVAEGHASGKVIIKIK